MTNILRVRHKTWYCHAIRYQPTYRIRRSQRALRNNTLSPKLTNISKDKSSDDFGSDSVSCEKEEQQHG